MEVVKDIKVGLKNDKVNGSSSFYTSERCDYISLHPLIIDKEIEKVRRAALYPHFAECKLVPNIIKIRINDLKGILYDRNFKKINTNLDIMYAFDDYIIVKSILEKDRYVLLTSDGIPLIEGIYNYYVYDRNYSVLDMGSSKIIINKNGFICSISQNSSFQVFSNNTILVRENANYFLYDFSGNILKSSKDQKECLELVDKDSEEKFQNFQKTLEKDFELYKKFLISILKRCEVLKNMPKEFDTIESITEYAFSLGLNLVIDLTSEEVKLCEFEDLIKIVDGYNYFWLKEDAFKLAYQEYNQGRKRKNEKI